MAPGIQVLILLVSIQLRSALHCGENSVRQIKVVGGQDVIKHEFPWQASITWRVGMMKGDHICGGSLIHMKYVLTAAHCFANGADPRYYNITLGGHNRESPDPLSQTIGIKKITLHEDYNKPLKFNNDIALIELERPALLSTAVNTICLPSFIEFELPKKLCTVTGWGKTSGDDDTLPDVLQKADVPIIPFKVCDGKTSYAGKLTRNMFCAGYADGRKDACSGDSGGPLQCRRASKYFILQGVTSFGDGCGAANKYGVYTVVRHYLKWIHEKSSGEVQVPALPKPPAPPTPGVPEPPIPGVKVPVPPIPGKKVPIPPIQGVKIPIPPIPGKKVPIPPIPGKKVPIPPIQGVKIPIPPIPGKKVPIPPIPGADQPISSRLKRFIDLRSFLLPETMNKVAPASPSPNELVKNRIPWRHPSYQFKDKEVQNDPFLRKIMRIFKKRHRGSNHTTSSPPHKTRQHRQVPFHILQKVAMRFRELGREMYNAREHLVYLLNKVRLRLFAFRRDVYQILREEKTQNQTSVVGHNRTSHKNV